MIRSNRFRPAGKKSRSLGQVPETIVVNVTESPIERPRRGQKQFYSGKKKRHTLKSQLVLDTSTRQIVCTAHAKGRRHDFHLWKASRVQVHPQTKVLGDRGYQGLAKLHANSQTPKKKPRGGSFVHSYKRFNQKLARQRVVAEHINRQLKIFRILAERYRNRGRRFGLGSNLIAALYSFELELAG